MKLNIALSEQAKAKIHTHKKKKSRCSFDYLNESYCND